MHDVAELELSAGTIVTVPKDTTIIRAGTGKLTIHMEKQLGFGGHPPKWITPGTARRCMGCAWQRHGTSLRLGTYGEWSSKEGGAQIALAIEVPVGVIVIPEGALSGQASVAAEQELGWWRKHRRDDRHYWYAAAVPATGWTALASRPERAYRAPQ